MSESNSAKPEVVIRSGNRSNAINFQPVTKDSTDHKTWFRGEHTNYLPHRKRLFSTKSVADSVLHGVRPEKPFINKSTRVTAFGSCFAANISNHLSMRKFNIAGKDAKENSAYVIRCGEGMVNTFVLRQQFEWAWENKQFEQALWHGYEKEEYGYDEDIRLATKDIFDNTDVFILTVGLSEIWYDDVTQNVFWRTIPKNSYDPKRHKFRVSTVEENTDNLTAIRALIKKYRPDAKLIVTLSPVPLVATFRDQACLVSNSVSKAVLRVAIDNFLSSADDDVYYWPSYELVNDVFSGSMAADMRHPKQDVLDFIMYLFESVWCESDPEGMDLDRRLAIALAACGKLPDRVGTMCKRENGNRLRSFTENTEFSKDAGMDKAIKKMLSALADEMSK